MKKDKIVRQSLVNLEKDEELKSIILQKEQQNLLN